MSNFYTYKFGRNASVGAAADIADVGSFYQFPVQAWQTRIVGGANDMVNSSGIHTVEVQGLTHGGIEATEVATLTAASPVTLANSYYRINRAFCRLNGGVKTNSFDISITHTGSATIARIKAGEGQTMQTAYTLPLKVSGSIIGWHVNAAKIANKSDVAASIRLKTRRVGETWRTRDSAEIVNGVNFNRLFNSEEAISLKALDDIVMSVVAVNTSNVAVSGGFEFKGFRSIR